MEEKLDSFDILLIEDNDDDAELTLRVFRNTGLVNNALHFQTAEMALSYLMNAEHLPKIALIDLNLTGGMSGLEFLRQLKNEKKTRQIRTAFLTGFVEQQFIDTFIIGTSAFFLKPLDPNKLAEIMAEVSEN
jgi:two-component system response regulator